MNNSSSKDSLKHNVKQSKQPRTNTVLLVQENTVVVFFNMAFLILGWVRQCKGLGVLRELSTLKRLQMSEQMSHGAKYSFVCKTEFSGRVGEKGGYM